MITLAAYSLLWGQPTPYPPDPGIQAIVNQISEDSIRANIGRLQAFHTRHTFSDTTGDSVGVGAALRWVEEKARSYDFAGRFSFEWFPWSHTWQGHQVTRNLLIARTQGIGQNLSRYILGGHLDSRGANLNDITVFAPGADDNGSSCAAFLELIRILPDTLIQNLEIIWFTGEEEGLWGSEAYAQHLEDTGERVDGMIAMDMISHITSSGGAIDSSSVQLYAEGTASQGGSASPSRNLQRYLRWVGESYATDLDLFILPAADRTGRGSDHLSFSGHGFPAIRVIERNEDLAYQHGPNDVVENTCPSYSRKIAQTAFGALLTMLKAPMSPPSPTLSWSGDNAIRITIPDSVALPTGCNFFLSIRHWTSSDFDSIVDLGRARTFLFPVAESGQTYAFSISRSNVQSLPSPFSIESVFEVTSASEQSSATILEPLLQVIPNPFNNETMLKITLARAGKVRLAVYDVLGREVQILTDNLDNRGIFTIYWNPTCLANGIYFARLEQGSFSETKKLILMK